MWNKLIIESGEYVNPPIFDVPVLAIGEWVSSGKKVPCVVKYVNEDDCSWRTIDDNSELDFSFNIIRWMDIPEY
jgi:hypothetical protein